LETEPEKVPEPVAFIDPRSVKPKIMPETAKNVHFDEGSKAPKIKYDEPLGFNVPYGRPAQINMGRKKKNLLGKDDKPIEEEPKKKKPEKNKIKLSTYI
jgi:hypothetical protein